MRMAYHSGTFISLSKIDLGVRKPNFLFVFRTSFANVPIGIKDLSFNGPLQIELKDLCGKVPFVSAAISYFTKPPKVDFRMTKAAEFVNNPMVSKNLKNLVSDSMKTQLLEPQRMVIPMAKSDASGNNGVPYGVHIWKNIWGWIRYSYSVNIIIIIWIKLLFCLIIIFNFWIIVYKYPMPKHLLELNVIEAKDLVNADSGPTQGKGMKFIFIDSLISFIDWTNDWF